MRWRMIWMNDNEIVQHMINFISEKERNAQAESLKGGSKTKVDIVKLILNELENKTDNEDK